jgi:energy-converting hydrogenase Eha subunit C
MNGIENSKETNKRNKPIKAPLAPLWVLLVAILLPGMGQVINNTPIKGLVMISFMLILGMITFNLAQPHISMVGKLAGGIFIYALSVMDAYYWAKYRCERFKFK